MTACQLPLRCHWRPWRGTTAAPGRPAGHSRRARSRGACGALGPVGHVGFSPVPLLARHRAPWAQWTGTAPFAWPLRGRGAAASLRDRWLSTRAGVLMSPMSKTCRAGFMQNPFSVRCLQANLGRPTCIQPICRTHCRKLRASKAPGCPAVRPPMRCSLQARPNAAPPIARRRLAVRSMQQPAAEAAQVCPPPPPPLFPLLQRIPVQQQCHCRAACLPAAPCRNAPSCSG